MSAISIALQAIISVAPGYAKKDEARIGIFFIKAYFRSI
jgi:hypothetical protein